MFVDLWIVYLLHSMQPNPQNRMQQPNMQQPQQQQNSGGSQFDNLSLADLL